MTGTSIVKWTSPIVVAALFAVAPVAAQSGQSLGSVRLPRNVTADGQQLPAGTYTLRLSTAPVTPVVGQSPEAAQWVEFVQGGQVKGRELATVVTPPDVKQVAKIAPPPAGSAKVQVLKGADYLRVWINRGGTQYLLHLGTPSK